jgi:hypothetical protein
MGDESSQLKGKRGKMLYIAFLHGMTESVGQKAFNMGTTSNSARNSVNWFESQATPTAPVSILVV